MFAKFLQMGACTSSVTAAVSLLAVLSTVAHAHDTVNRSDMSTRLNRAHQSKWLATTANEVPYNGYTSPDWRRSVYNKNCTDAFLFQDVRIVGDKDCAVSNALFLLLRQSYRFNMQRWADDMSDTEFVINRTMYAHELIPSGSRQSFVLQYSQPSTSCLLWASNVTNTSISPIITSVSVFKADADSVTFALFSAPTKSSTFVQARVNANKSTSLSFAKAEGLHRLKNHAPSAAFLPSDNLAVANLGWNDYDVTLYAQEGDKYVDLKMLPSFRVGGENIGSLFRSGSSLHMSARVNVPYFPLDRVGHGYRSIGLYNITRSPTGIRSDLIDWVSPDACMSECLQAVHETCGEEFLLNATYLLQCLPRNGYRIHQDSGNELKNVYAPCLRRALIDHNTSCMGARKESLVNSMVCAQRCRADNQIYQPAISYMRDAWYGVAGRTSYDDIDKGNKEHGQSNNPLLFCRLSKSFAWSPRCFNENAALMNDPNGKLGHPLTSQIVDLNGRILLATAGGHGSKVPEKDRCTTYLHSWEASNFSYFRAAEAASKSYKVALSNLALPGNEVNVLYGSKQSTAPCSENIVLHAFNDKHCRTTRIGGRLFSNNTGDVRFRIDCALHKATLNLHVHVPSFCRLYGIGP